MKSGSETKTNSQSAESRLTKSGNPILQYLLKNSDENDTKSAYDIIGYLEGCGM